MDPAIGIAVLGLTIFSIFTRLHVRRLDRKIDRLRSVVSEIAPGYII